MNLILPQARIYHVLCPSYHGATVLSALLQNHSQITSLGDTIPIRAIDSMCTCGKKVSECDFWQELYDRINLSRFANERQWLSGYPRLLNKPSDNSSSTLNRLLNQLMLGLTIPFGGNVWKLAPQAFQEYYETYINFVNFITKRNQSSVFVDGSKRRFTPTFVQSYSNNQVPAKVIHITRNPLNFVQSAVDQRKSRPANSIEEAAKQWVFGHSQILRIKKSFLNKDSYFRLAYEDLCDNPQDSIESILDFLELKSESLQKPFVFPNKNHILGSRSIHKFDGTVKKSTNDSNLSTDEIKKIYKMTEPLLKEFRYDTFSVN